MKKFTIKDYINYCSPCLCGKKPTIHVYIIDIYDNEIFLRTTIANNILAFDLFSGWDNRLSLYIDCVLNKFTTNDNTALIKFLKTNKIVLSSNCKSCHSNSTTEILKFDFTANHIKAFEISREEINCDTTSFVANIRNDYKSNNGVLYIYTDNTNFRFDIDNWPKTKFKNKKQLIDKIKTYLLFS